ncbi:MAG: glutamate 5-kinase [Pseudomonadota bacterium]
MGAPVTAAGHAALWSGARAARRMVIKVGSSLLVDGKTGLQRAWLDALADDIAHLAGQGRQIIVVSSGAIALGRRRLGLNARPRSLTDAQACAAVGQIALAQSWTAALARHDLAAAQMLLTLADLEGRRTYLNARETLERLLKLRAVPVINENDSTATEEIRFGDNDRLAARVAQMMAADLLILFSDIDGLYSADPARDQTACFIPEVSGVSTQVEAMAGGAQATGIGSGGMVTKLAAARIATEAGVAMLIARGSLEHPLRRLEEGGRATLFHPVRSRRDARKLWIAGRLRLAGRLIIDDGAIAALKSGKSLLPAGLVAVEGDFERGDAVAISDREGRLIARGLAAYDGAEARALIGAKSGEIAARLGYGRTDELVHRDDLVLEASR